MLIFVLESIKHTYASRIFLKERSLLPKGVVILLGHLLLNFVLYLGQLFR